MTSSVPARAQPGRYVWLVWQREWTGSADERRFGARLLMVCSTLDLALREMVRDGTSTWTQQVELDVGLAAPDA